MQRRLMGGPVRYRDMWRMQLPIAGSELAEKLKTELKTSSDAALVGVTGELHAEQLLVMGEQGQQPGVGTLRPLRTKCGSPKAQKSGIPARHARPEGRWVWSPAGHFVQALRLWWSLRRCGIMLVAPPHEMVQSEWDFVGMHRTPGDDALQLDAIIGHRADLHEFGFDDICVPHIHLQHDTHRNGPARQRRCRPVRWY